jgi:hypothetical protein
MLTKRLVKRAGDGGFGVNQGKRASTERSPASRTSLDLDGREPTRARMAADLDPPRPPPSRCAFSCATTAKLLYRTDRAGVPRVYHAAIASYRASRRESSVGGGQSSTRPVTGSSWRSTRHGAGSSVRWRSSVRSIPTASLRTTKPPLRRVHHRLRAPFERPLKASSSRRRVGSGSSARRAPGSSQP